MLYGPLRFKTPGVVRCLPSKRPRQVGSPKESRTPVSAVTGQHPGPLNDGTISKSQETSYSIALPAELLPQVVGKTRIELVTNRSSLRFSGCWLSLFTLSYIRNAVADVYWPQFVCSSAVICQSGTSVACFTLDHREENTVRERIL